MLSKIKNKKYTIAICLLLTIIAIFFMQKSYYALIIALFGIYGLITTALDILFGYTGQISLGHAGLFAIGAYSTTLLTMKLNIPSCISLILGTILTTLIGCLIAIPASRLIKHFLSLLMIAFGQIIYLVINSWTELTGGSLGIMYIPDLNIFGLVFDNNIKYAVLIWIILIIIIVLKNNLIKSKFGLAFIAIRENTTAAKSLGINTYKYKILAFAISAMITGLAGGLYAFLRGFISPETFNSTQSILFMTMLLFGGMTTSFGPIIGASVLLFCREAFQSFSTWQGVIYAGFMIIILFFFPNGIVGIFNNVKKYLKKLLNKKMNTNVKSL